MELPATSITVRTSRLVSIDALRGFSMFWIVGGDGAIWALAEMLRGKGAALDGIGAFLSTQMTHVAWEGFRFYDFIFPLFIFVTGVSIVLSLPRLVEREGKQAAHVRVLRRTLLLYGLGIIYYGGVGQHWADIRVLGVLQRIALFYGIASLLLLNLNVRGLVAVCMALLVGYWALMTFVPVPGIGSGSFAPDANLANWIDAHYLPGRLWDKTRDPEGLLSTLPAIATCLIGVLSGILLRRPDISASQKSAWLIGGGIVMTAAGYLWALQFPLIKSIWSPSFVLATGGMRAILLGIFHQVIDVWGYKRWTPVFVWIGANAITLYLLNALMGFDVPAKRIAGGEFGARLDALLLPGIGALLVNLVALGLVIALAGYLYRRKIFLRV